MFLSDMEKAVGEAKNTLSNADLCVRKMAEMCAGRLRVSVVSSRTLERLKRELRGYNIHTRRWRD